MLCQGKECAGRQSSAQGGKPCILATGLSWRTKSYRAWENKIKYLGPTIAGLVAEWGLVCDGTLKHGRKLL